MADPVDAYAEHCKRLRAEAGLDTPEKPVYIVDLPHGGGFISSDGTFVFTYRQSRRPEHDQIDPFREREPGPTLKGWKAGDR